MFYFDHEVTIANSFIENKKYGLYLLQQFVEVNLDTIAQTIKRYYKPPLKKHNWEVDIDLSKGKLLTEQEYDKFFNLKLSKTQQRKPTPKKEKHFSLDYRSVND